MSCIPERLFCHEKGHSICQSQRSLLQWPVGWLVQWHRHVSAVKSLCRWRMCDFYRHADRTKKETGTSVDGGSKKANFWIVTGSLHFPFIHLVWAFIFFSFIIRYSLFVLYLISPEQVFHGTLGNLIWLSSTVFKAMAGNFASLPSSHSQQAFLLEQCHSC